jgi:hypothetical protein
MPDKSRIQTNYRMKCRSPFSPNTRNIGPDGTQLAALLWDHHLVAWDLRRIRQELAGMNLDWEGPPFAPATQPGPSEPLRVTLNPFSPEELARRIPPRAPQTEARLIDLGAYFNAPLTETWHTQGADEAAGLTNDLSALPRGRQTLAGVEFDVRGVVQLSIPGWPGRYPERVAGIKVGQPCRRLHFLHATGWVVPDGTVIGRYVIHYADGQRAEVPIRYGQDVRDWWV